MRLVCRGHVICVFWSVDSLGCDGELVGLAGQQACGGVGGAGVCWAHAGDSC